MKWLVVFLRIPGGDMAGNHGTDGAILKAARMAAGVSLSGMSARMHYSRSYLSNVENGRKSATPELIAAYESALGLGDLVGEQGDMRRRALVAMAGMGMASPVAVGEMIRRSLLAGVGVPDEDWDAVVAERTRQLVTDPSAEYGSGLLGDLVVLRQRVSEGGADRDLLRAAARLGQCYGLWCGNRGDLAGALRWYRSSMSLADASGDLETRVFVRGRSLSRGLYEGCSVGATLAGVEEALALSRRPSLGMVEAYLARWFVFAMVRDAERGRRVAGEVRDVAARLPAGTGARERVLFAHAYAECRYGSLDEAERACAEATPALRAWPTWLTETEVHRGRAMVAAGDVRGGVGCALDAVGGGGHDVRVIRLAVRDVLTLVPRATRFDELDQLRRYARGEGLS
jgi:transcriptional regulator with XRE-family HTH domain